MSIWFSSDTHYNHRNIITHCRRPHENVETMNDEMIRKWNERVSADDLVYFLGDFCFHAAKNIQDIFSRLRGKKVLINGNHDQRETVRLPWVDVHPYYELKHHNQLYVLFHYPIADWNKKHHGSLHLHGHSHGLSAPMKNRIDVGVDCHDFYPISLEQVSEVMYD